MPTAPEASEEGHKQTEDAANVSTSPLLSCSPDALAEMFCRSSLMPIGLMGLPKAGITGEARLALKITVPFPPPLPLPPLPYSGLHFPGLEYKG